MDRFIDRRNNMSSVEDPGPTFEKNADPDPTFKKNANPDPTLTKT